MKVMPGKESMGTPTGTGTQGGSGSGGCRGLGWQELVQGRSCLHRSSELYYVDFFQAALRMRVLRRQRIHQMCYLREAIWGWCSAGRDEWQGRKMVTAMASATDTNSHLRVGSETQRRQMDGPWRSAGWGGKGWGKPPCFANSLEWRPWSPFVPLKKCSGTHHSSLHNGALLTPQSTYSSERGRSPTERSVWLNHSHQHRLSKRNQEPPFTHPPNKRISIASTHKFKTRRNNWMLRSYNTLGWE